MKITGKRIFYTVLILLCMAFAVCFAVVMKQGMDERHERSALVTEIRTSHVGLLEELSFLWLKEASAHEINQGVLIDNQVKLIALQAIRHGVVDRMPEGIQIDWRLYADAAGQLRAAIFKKAWDEDDLNRSRAQFDKDFLDVSKSIQRLDALGSAVQKLEVMAQAIENRTTPTTSLDDYRKEFDDAKAVINELWHFRPRHGE